MLRSHPDSKTDNEDQRKQDTPSPNKLLFYYEANKITPHTLSRLLEENSAVTHLEFTQCYIGDSGVDIIIDAIDCRKLLRFYASHYKNRTYLEDLQFLKISGDVINASQAANLMEMINRHLGPYSFVLSNVCLDDDLKKFSEHLAANTSLTELNLSDNHITDDGIIILANHLKNNTSLTHLILDNTRTKSKDGADGNIIITQKGLDALQELFKNNHWMKKIVTPSFTLQRKSPAKNHSGDTISLAMLKEIINTSANIDVQIKEYLTHFNIVKDNDMLSGEDLFEFIEMIHRISQPDDNTFSSHPVLNKLFNMPYFLEAFLLAYKLSIINKTNFETFYALSPEEIISLSDLLREDSVTANTLVSIDKINYLNILLSQSQPLLWDLMNRIIDIVGLSRKTLLSLLSLSVTNIERLHEVVVNLAEIRLLTRDAYHTAFNKITAKQPKVFASGFDKKSRKEKQHNLTHSRLTLDHGLTLFIEHKDDKKYLAGGFGSVKKAYESTQDETPSYGVKKLFDRGENHEEIPARDSVKYNRLLGRKAYYYNKNDLYNIVFEWQPGKSLNQFSPDTLESTSPHTRFQWIVSGLSQLEMLHSHFCIHRDIKHGNFVIDISTNQMTLIDLDRAQKKGSHQSPFGTQTFLDITRTFYKRNLEADFCDDIYAMGKVIEVLYGLDHDHPDRRFGELKTQALTPIEFAISLLVSAMKEPDRSIRCTSENALDYCQKILPLITHCSVLDATIQKKIKQIAHETILRIHTLTIEDVMRGKYNTAKLQLDKLMANINADINQDIFIQDSNWKPLIAACETGHNEAIAYLLKHKDIDMNIHKPFSDATPLQIAYSSDFADYTTLSLLLDHPGVNADEKIALLYTAFKDERHDIVELLLQRAEPAMMEKLNSVTGMNSDYEEKPGSCRFFNSSNTMTKASRQELKDYLDAYKKMTGSLRLN